MLGRGRAWIRVIGTVPLPDWKWVPLTARCAVEETVRVARIVARTVDRVRDYHESCVPFGRCADVAVLRRTLPW